MSARHAIQEARSAESLATRFSLAETVEYVVERGYKAITLQFPDELLSEAPRQRLALPPFAVTTAAELSRLTRERLLELGLSFSKDEPQTLKKMAFAMFDTRCSYRRVSWWRWWVERRGEEGT